MYSVVGIGQTTTIDPESLDMTDIVLTTINAKYIHASFGLRYLQSNLGELAVRSKIIEFTIQDRAIDMAEALLAEQPKVIGIGVYIWNAELSRDLVAIIKRVQPAIKVILGGPEVSHEWEQQEIVAMADYVVGGEGEEVFATLCQRVLTRKPSLTKFIQAQPSTIATLKLPYHLYQDQDIAHRILYIEASRGCPFRCEFCLSSLDQTVRNFPLDSFLVAMEHLISRGVRHFKFVDRTFNLRADISSQIVQFFLDRYQTGMFLHFEMIPDRLPDALRDLIARFPPGALQFEVGIQTFNNEVAARINRKQNISKIEENLHFLRNHTGVHVHADLIVGLPGETLESFGQGLDKLIDLGPQEIQIGILKRLRGTPIVRHDDEWEMIYSDRAPYEILRTKTISFSDMQRMKRFAQVWDHVVNRGNFNSTWRKIAINDSMYAGMLDFSDWLFAKIRRTHSIALNRLAGLVYRYLTEVRRIQSLQVMASIEQDFIFAGRVPPTPRELVQPKSSPEPQSKGIPARQARHVGLHSESL